MVRRHAVVTVVLVVVMLLVMRVVVLHHRRGRRLVPLIEVIVHSFSNEIRQLDGIVILFGWQAPYLLECIPFPLGGEWILGGRGGGAVSGPWW